MALNFDAIGKPLGPVRHTYSWKEAVLYALAVGAGFEELEYCYEKELKILPSFAVAAIFDFFFKAAARAKVNLAGALHGEQDLVFERPLPPQGTLITNGHIGHIYDQGPDKGALIVAQSTTCDDSGQKLFTSTMTIYARLDGGFGGIKAPSRKVAFPDRPPDIIQSDTPSKDQPLLYRLTGDLFQLHVDPDFARKSGFEKPIMHGMGTHGFACRALVQSLTPGAPQRIRRMLCRFSKPLYPGTPIKTQIWKTGPGRAQWRTINALSEAVVIDQGLCEYDTPTRLQPLRFDGQVAIVTGAGGALGRTYALELAQRGARVVVNDLGGAKDGSDAGSRGPADQVVAEIKAMGAEAVASYDSVASASGGKAIVQAALEAFGRLDILINNAGILRDKSFGKLTPEAWQTVIDVHLNGAYHVSQPAFAAMKKQGFGRIVMTTSAAGLYGNFGQTNYAAAKMGLVGLMNALKIEGAKYNIGVNAIAPVAASRLTAELLPVDWLERLDPSFVAPLVLYLCSKACTISGQIFNAGMGCYNRAAVVTGRGVVLNNGRKPPSVEMIAAQFERITSLDDGQEHQQAFDLITDIMQRAPQ